MGQRVDVTLPVPRSLPLAGALAWASREFERFRGQGWEIEGEWVLDMGTDGWRGKQGWLRFVAVFGAGSGKGAGQNGAVRGFQGDGAGQAVIAGVQVWADGGVRWSGALTEGQRHACLAALGVAELVRGAEQGSSSKSR